MTFRKLIEQSEVSAPSTEDLSLAQREQLQSPEATEEYEMMLAGLEDFEVERILVGRVMEEFELGESKYSNK